LISLTKIHKTKIKKYREGNKATKEGREDRRKPMKERIASE
jgi:hypothetical protein